VATYGGVEAGGTKLVCVIGTPPDGIVATRQIAVGDPGSTLGEAVAFFEERIAAGTRIDALGIASFGPLELRERHPEYGHITVTPKPGWSGVDMVGTFRDALGVPIGFDTDTNGAALAEMRWGAAQGLASFVYLTLGTGIGGAVVVDGHAVHGLVHPEMGHVPVPRRPQDTFAGVCPFHGDCLEGMASGPAIAARFGRRAEELEGEDVAAAAEVVAYYLASALRGIVFTVAPERIVLGGGLSQVPGLVVRTRRALARQVSNYPALVEHQEAGFVVPARLGQGAGPAGALLLAEQAAARVIAA
jgi:fructokinase